MSNNTQVRRQKPDPDETRESHIAALEHRVKEQDRELKQLRKKLGEPEQRDRRGAGGTPNLSGDVSGLLSQGPPKPTEYEEMANDEMVLHNMITDGPGVMTDESPIYPVHERAHDVLVHATSLAREKSKDDTALFLTAPTVKRFLESKEKERLKHTQVRRAFEQIESAGKEYPRPPVLHKNRDGVVELVIFDYDRLFDQTLLR